MNKEGPGFNSRKWGVIGLACGVPLFVAGAYFGRPDKGEVAFMSIAMLVLVGREFWRNRSSIWYWVAVLLAVALGAGAVSVAHLGQLGRPAILVFAPYAIADFLILFALFRSAEKLALRGTS